jgi:phosphoribosylformylglycinamidine cyclo-ligase
VLFTISGWDVDRHVDELGRSLGDELLEPTRVYALDCLALARRPACQVHAFAHITGGGLAANLARVLPSHLSAVVDRGSWTPAPVFGLIAALGGVERAERERTFNDGVGMVAVVGADGAGDTLSTLAERGVEAWVCGQVSASEVGQEPDPTQQVVLVGDHPGR